jgi:outer membrane protein
MKRRGSIAIVLMLFTALVDLLQPHGLRGEMSLKIIGLEDAISMAKQNNPDFKIALHKQKADHEKVNQAWGMLYPIFESEVSLLRQGAESGFLSVSDGQYDIKIAQVKFGINPGMFYNSLQLSRKAYIASTEEIRRIKSEIEYSVIESYFNLILAEEMIGITKETIQLLQENLKDVTSLYKSGSVPRYELLQAQVQLKSQEPLLIEAENRYLLALEMFNYQLGLDEKVYRPDRNIIERDDYRIAEKDIDSFVKRTGGLALQNRP